MEKIYTQIWLEQPRDIREHLVKIFNIPQTGIREIRDASVISDGYTNADLSVITMEVMEKYVGPCTDFNHAWKVSVSKAKFELHPPLFEIKPTGIVEDIETPTKIETTNTTLSPKFCNKCDSKGGRHLKACPKFK